MIAGFVVAGVIGLALASTFGASTPPIEVSDLLYRVVRRIAEHEGGGRFDAVNPNNERFKDPPGPGVSFGFIQWTQKSGHLGKLLTAMWAADPGTFETIVGGSTVAAELLRVTRAGSLAPVAGEVLWSPVWVDRFKRLGRVRQFEQIQLFTAAGGVHMRAALECVEALALQTERGIALAFDRCVQQGEFGIPAIARGLAAEWKRDGWPSYSDRLAKFGAACVAKAPSTWRADVQRRVSAILGDPGLADLDERHNARVS